MEYKTSEEIKAENAVIAKRLSDNFGEAILQTVTDDYARYDLDKITEDLKIAEEHGLVFDVSRGPEVLGFITPEQVIERFSKKENFRSYYSLITPNEAIAKLSQKIEENAEHFSTFSPEIQAERSNVFAQNENSLKRMISSVRQYSQSHAKINPHEITL